MNDYVSYIPDNPGISYPPRISGIIFNQDIISQPRGDAKGNTSLYILGYPFWLDFTPISTPPS